MREIPLRPFLTAVLLLLVLVGPLAREARGEAAPAHGEADGAAADAPAPVSVGEFSLRDTRAAVGTKSRLRFTLHLEPPTEHKKNARSLVASHKHRIRDAVITAVRTCQQSDFQEPGLERLRRRIQVRLRRVVPELEVERVLISQFEFFVE